MRTALPTKSLHQARAPLTLEPIPAIAPFGFYQAHNRALRGVRTGFTEGGRTPCPRALPLQATAGGDGTAGWRGGLRTLLGGKAERFEMGPAVVLGQRLAERAGPVGHRAPADLAAGDRQPGDGDRETA
jgi:hypothetical protein